MGRALFPRFAIGSLLAASLLAAGAVARADHDDDASPAASPTPTPTPTVNTDVLSVSSSHTNAAVASPTPSVVAIDQSAVVAVRNPQVNTGTVVTNISQENRVFFGPEPSPVPTPTPTPTPKVSVNEAIRLTITDDRDSVRPGERLTYRIVIRNFFPQRDVSLDKVRVRIPEFVIPVQFTGGAVENPKARTIEWLAQTISADAEVTYAVIVRVDDFAPPDFPLNAVADINGPGVRQGAEDITFVRRLDAIAAAREASAPDVAAGAAEQPAAPVTAATGTAASFILISSLISGIGAWRLRRLSHVWITMS